MDKQQEGAIHCLSPEVLATYLDRNLTLKEKAQVEAHLVLCSKCRQIISLAHRTKSSHPMAKQDKDK
jgi:predicted anti-sigma-YlaC factor YlaD